MTDGGIVDSIPVIKAYEMGVKEITVVLSRPLGYRKSTKTPLANKASIKSAPQLATAMLNRAQHYNQAIDFISQPPKDAKVHVITPPAEFKVGRLTTNKVILKQGYSMGIQAAAVALNRC